MSISNDFSIKLGDYLKSKDCRLSTRREKLATIDKKRKNIHEHRMKNEDLIFFKHELWHEFMDYQYVSETKYVDHNITYTKDGIYTSLKKIKKQKAQFPDNFRYYKDNETKEWKVYSLLETTKAKSLLETITESNSISIFGLKGFRLLKLIELIMNELIQTTFDNSDNADKNKVKEIVSKITELLKDLINIVWKEGSK